MLQRETILNLHIGNCSIYITEAIDKPSFYRFMIQIINLLTNFYPQKVINEFFVISKTQQYIMDYDIRSRW